jgi:asparagine synthase (glutamine-hydrolysing)
VLSEIGRLTVRADVPVGVALSGGLDSSALAALACENAAGSVHTFTVGYEGGGRHDESHLAASFASRLGTQHRRVTVEDAWVVKEFPRMCLARDEPISDISGLGYLAVSRAAREAGVPVLLLGHGSDELFWGYPWSAPAVRANLRKEKLLAGSAGLGTYLRAQRPPFSYSGLVTWALEVGGFRSGLHAWRRDRSSPPGQMVFFDQQPGWSAAAEGLDRVALPSFLERVGSVKPERHFTFSAIPHRPDLEMTDLFLRTYLLSNGISQSDRLSMAESVECRLPLVDYRLVETVIGLRRRIQDWRLPPKIWLRDALGDLVPKEVSDRPKRGFTPPWRRWSTAIFREHGGALLGGSLANMDVLRPMASVPSPFDRFGRASAVALPALTLELWAQGMRDLERSWNSARSSPDLAAWTRETVRGG